MTFYDFFDTSFQKNVKSHVFFKYEKRKIRILEHWFHVYALYKSTLTLTHTTWSTMALVNSSDSNYNTSVSMPHFKMYASATECIWSYYDLEL